MNMRINELNCFNKIKESYLNNIGIKKEFDNSDHFIMDSIFNSTHQNEKQNEFPDFLFDGGVIEHFEVTASNETRKGSKYKIHSIEAEKENEKFFCELDREFLKSEFHPGTCTSATREDMYDSFRMRHSPHLLNVTLVSTFFR